MISIKSLKYLYEKPNIKELPVVALKKEFNIKDVKDQDMMVAILIASIDYQQQTKGDVKVISCKQIS